MNVFVIPDQVLLWAANVLIHATVLTVVSLLIAMLFRKAAVTRYWVLCLGMLLVLGSPLISALIQSRGDSLLTVSMPVQEMPNVASPPPPHSVVKDRPELARATGFDSAPLAEAPQVSDPVITPIATTVETAPTPPVVVSETTVGIRPGNDSLRTIGAPLIAVWATGSWILLIRMSIGWIRMARILKHAKLVENAELQRAFERACKIAQPREPSDVGQWTSEGLRPAAKYSVRPRLVVSDAVSGPIAAGILGGTVVLPRRLVEQVDAMPGSVGFFTDRWQLEHRVAGLLDAQRDRKTFLSKRGWLFVATSTLGLGALMCVGTITIATAQNTRQESTTKPDSDSSPMTINGIVRGQDGDPIAGAKIWLAVTSHEFNSEANQENRQGLLRELGSADKQGRFEFVLDAVTTQEIHRRSRFAQAQLVATAQGADWTGCRWRCLRTIRLPASKETCCNPESTRRWGTGVSPAGHSSCIPNRNPCAGGLLIWKAIDCQT